MLCEVFKMSEIIIEGSRRLTGELTVQGSKNSVLPILAATVTARGENVIHNCPYLSDVEAALEILRKLGCKVKREGHTVTVNSETVASSEISESLMHEMRSSVMFLGAILGRTGKAVLSAPGGCEIGLRPIDIHISAAEQLGAELTEKCGKLSFRIPNGLRPANITLPFPSVGATENLLLLASVTQGTTVIHNAAREPEIKDLADFLNLCGARIANAGESTVYITGVKELHSAEYTVMTDRIAGCSYLLAAAVTGGSLRLNNLKPAHIGAVIPVLREMGCSIVTERNSVLLNAPQRLKRVRIIRTMPYPGFPTDIQAPMTAALSVADGTSAVIENIFESRFKHTGELVRMGAVIHTEGRIAVIEGVRTLCGARVRARDLRGGFALITAALKAQGKSTVTGAEHIYRGYEEPEKVLASLGAEIKKVDKNGRKTN